MCTTGENFLVWACLFLTAFVLLVIIIAPIVIWPMFYKFEALEENILKTDVESLASDLAFPLKELEVIDGSTRSNHSNAFFYGFGKIKKIVLFDTLLE